MFVTVSDFVCDGWKVCIIVGSRFGVAIQSRKVTRVIESIVKNTQRARHLMPAGQDLQLVVADLDRDLSCVCKLGLSNRPQVVCDCAAACLGSCWARRACRATTSVVVFFSV